MKILLPLIWVACAASAFGSIPQGDVVAEAGQSRWIGLNDNGEIRYHTDAKGNRIPDFSWVGYHSGAKPLPQDVPVALELSPQQSDDDTVRIQEALDAVSQLPLGENGLRGKLLLKKGEYRVGGRLRIAASGVVFSGEGDGADGTVIVATGYTEARSKRTLIEVGGGVRLENLVIPQSDRQITDTFVPIGAHRFTVDSADGYAVGDRVLVYRPATQEWISSIGCDRIPPRMTPVFETYWKETGNDRGFYYKRRGFSGHGAMKPEAGEDWQAFRKRVDERFSPDKTSMNVVEQWRPEEYPMYFERVVTAIDGNVIEVDAPLVHPLEARFGGAILYRYDASVRISEVGVENMRLISEFAKPVAGHPYGDPAQMTRAENHGWNAVRINSGVENSWVRNIVTQYFGYAAVSSAGTAITITDCASLEQASRIEGGRRYPFVVNGQRTLVQRCKTIGGRHEFAVQAKTLGPNVFVDCIGIDSQAQSGPHHRYAVGTLFDNVSSQREMESKWRGNSGTGHGWAGVQTLFYNCRAPYFDLSAPAGGYVWVIGSGPDASAARDHIAPPSLYYAQLRERLGDEALQWAGRGEGAAALGNYQWAQDAEFPSAGH